MMKRLGLLLLCAIGLTVAHTVLVIGHNPGLQEAAELLIAAGDVELRERLREKFPTAALSVIHRLVDYIISASGIMFFKKRELEI